MFSKPRRFGFVIALLAWLAAVPAVAEEEVVVGDSAFIPLAENKPYMYVIHNGRSVKIQRVQDQEYELKGYFAKTARKCPPFCIQPISVDPRVQTIGEIELFDFMEGELRDGRGLLIDARTPTWYEKGTIPGSINIPFTELSKEPSDPVMAQYLKDFGAKPRGEVGAFTRFLEKWGLIDATFKTDNWDFSEAKDLVLWCNGPACGQSPRAIRGLLAAEYPPEKIKYYRGGMQLWQLWGLTTVTP